VVDAIADDAELATVLADSESTLSIANKQLETAKSVQQEVEEVIGIKQ
jgi:hypothetical protein